MAFLMFSIKETNLIPVDLSSREVGSNMNQVMISRLGKTLKHRIRVSSHLTKYNGR